MASTPQPPRIPLSFQPTSPLFLRASVPSRCVNSPSTSRPIGRSVERRYKIPRRIYLSVPVFVRPLTPTLCTTKWFFARDLPVAVVVGCRRSQQTIRAKSAPSVVALSSANEARTSKWAEVPGELPAKLDKRSSAVQRLVPVLIPNYRTGGIYAAAGVMYLQFVYRLMNYDRVGWGATERWESPPRSSWGMTYRPRVMTCNL